MVTSSDPLIAFDPDHAPEAEHEVELVEDQVRDITVSRSTDEEDEERLAVGLGSGAGALPPPPPPQETTNNNTNKFLQTNLEIDFIHYSFLKHFYIYKHNMCFF